MPLSTLTFNSLQYQIADIVNTLNDYPDTAYFVFSFVATGTPVVFELSATAMNANNIYYAGSTPLLPFGDQDLTNVNVAILSNNFVSSDVIKSLIDYSDNNSDNPNGYLLFAPALSINNYLYYNITAVIPTGDGEVTGNGGTGTTNPSPPAMLTIG